MQDDFGFMEDCMHLKACRRIMLLARQNGCRFGRKCNEDCSAYVSTDDDTRYVTVKDAVAYAQDGADSIRGGWSEYNVYAPQDLKGRTLKQLVNGD